MAQVLRSVFPEELIDHIAALMPEDHRIEWETVYGATLIYRTKHFVTYGGGPEGGVCVLLSGAGAGVVQLAQRLGDRGKIYEA